MQNVTSLLQNVFKSCEKKCGMCEMWKYVLYTFFYKQSIFDPRPENRLSFSKKSPQKIV